LKINPVKQFKTICSLNVTVRKVESDGNCFFRALSDQLCGSQEGHLVLRLLIIDYICENREKFETSIDHEHFRNWDDFTYRMRQHGTFADGIVVAASALSLRRSLIIHQETQRPVLFKPLISNTNHQQLHLAYDCKTLHYNSLCSVNDDKLYLNESECIFG
jgi:OTU domain-containing protein 3